jgi:transposase
LAYVNTHSGWVLEHAFSPMSAAHRLEIASNERSRHRLSRSVDQKLNSAIHLMVVTQLSMHNCVGQSSCHKTISEGQIATTRSAALCDDSRTVSGELCPPKNHDTT